MEERHRIFIESIKNRRARGNRELLDTVMKAYVLNEGLLDDARKAGKAVAGKVSAVAGKVADKAKAIGRVDMPVPEEPKAAIDYPALRRAMLFEKDCWERDYLRFEQLCDFVTYYVSNYGIKDFNELSKGEDFKKAMAMGAQLDKMRQNPLIPSDSRRKYFHECLERLAEGGDRAVVEAVLADFDRSEAMYEHIPMLESREDNLGEFRNAMAGIANFIRRHGLYPWTEFLRKNRLLLARASRFDPKGDYAADPNPVPGPSMAADILRAYHSGSSDEYKP